MNLSSKVHKTKGTENQQVTKISKSDNNKESIKQSEKAQPTAEQMRIALIIDTKTEDPSLKEKLKQVMDATQKSIDDAYTALHDCDNDANKAVNLLLEGIESQWSTSSKKEKNTTVIDKNIKEKEVPPEPTVEENHWDAVVNSKPTPANKTGNFRGRGRGFRGGRITTNTQNNDTNDRIKKNTKVLNGPGLIRGWGGRARPHSRGYGRGRGMFRRPMETWDPQRSVSTNLNHDNPEDWKNEEYTGSLANSQMYTSSGTSNSPPINSCIILGGTSSIISDDFDKKNQLQVDISSGKAGSILSKNTELNSLTIPFHKSFSALPDAAISSPVGMRSPTMGSNLIMISPRPERTSMLMTSQQNQEDSNMSEKEITPPIGVRSPPMTSNLIMMGLSNLGTDRAIITSQEIRIHKPRPKIPPPSKIPATAVEMPPDSVENNIGLLDVQFGALELSEVNDLIHLSPPITRHSPSPVSSDKLLHQSSSTSDSLLLSESSYSPVRNNSTSLSPISDLSSKVSDVSSSLYQEPTYQTLYSKTAQQSPSVHSSTYSSGQIISTSSIIYSTSSSQSTYSSSTGGVYGGISSSYPHYQYNSYPSQQTQTLPVLSNSSNSYQSVLGSQQYGSSSQSVYGTSGLPTASYTTPYQTYNSSLQHNHKQALVSSTSSSKEFETTQSSVNLSSISHSGSINPTPTLLSASQTTPTSKPTSISSMGKSTVVTNMPPGVPPLAGTHQYIMGQGGIPYFQQPMYYEDLQLMQQQRLAPHISTGYYEMGYPTSTTREGVQYNMSDGRFARTDNTSPVQASSISQQQSGSQAHQQPMMNPTAIPPAYAYFYGGSAMIPGNFQYGAPTLYPIMPNQK